MDINEYIKQMVRKMMDEESASGDAGGYLTPNAFAKKGQGKNVATKTAEKQGFKVAKKPTTSKVVDYKKIFEVKIQDIIDQELINEATYSKFKKDISYRSKTEMLHKGIKEVKRKLAEIDRIVEYTSRMKQELSEGEEGIKYWKATEKNVTQIAEIVNTLNEKIKNLYK